MKIEDLDGRNRSVFYRDSLLKMGLKAVNILASKFGQDPEQSINLLAEYFPAVRRFFGPPSLKTSMRQKYEGRVLTMDLPLPLPNSCEVEVHVDTSDLVIIWRTVEPSPEHDWFSKMTISLLFTPRESHENRYRSHRLPSSHRHGWSLNSFMMVNIYDI